ncbi:MAG: DUF5690 family protein, partial [Cellvibrionaceae bacterium]|nr:DUF5690 family protein [Cellvibrionaceae bacterium]
MKALLARLQKDNQLLFCLLVASLAFATYSCMYAFRKPIAVGLYADLAYWGISLKVLYLIAQILGYALSKFIGIKVVSELAGQNRAHGILLLISIAALALLGFALVPAPYNIPFMFLNGLPLGMVWGFVFGYLEGRRVTEILAAGLCASFIVASGVVKSVGAYLMLSWGVSEFWMPFVTGMVFFPPLIISALLLQQIPAPDAGDIRARHERKPMDGAQRLALLKKYGFGLSLLVAAYLLLTVLRDLRDNFMADIWAELGYQDSPEIFTLTELPIALIVLLMIAAMVMIKDNRRALAINHLMVIVGLGLCAGSTLAFQAGLTGPELWVISSGLGLYMGYVPFNSVLFERLIANFNEVANVGFLIYLADSF